MHPLFSFSSYRPIDSTPHSKETNEYRQYRSDRETYKMAKNTHEKRNVAMVRVTGNT